MRAVIIRKHSTNCSSYTAYPSLEAPRSVTRLCTPLPPGECPLRREPGERSENTEKTRGGSGGRASGNPRWRTSVSAALACRPPRYLGVDFLKEKRKRQRTETGAQLCAPARPSRESPHDSARVREHTREK